MAQRRQYDHGQVNIGSCSGYEFCLKVTIKKDKFVIEANKKLKIKERRRNLNDHSQCVDR